MSRRQLTGNASKCPAWSNATNVCSPTTQQSRTTSGQAHQWVPRLCLQRSRPHRSANVPKLCAFGAKALLHCALTDAANLWLPQNFPMRKPKQSFLDGQAEQSRSGQALERGGFGSVRNQFQQEELGQKYQALAHPCSRLSRTGCGPTFLEQRSVMLSLLKCVERFRTSTTKDHGTYRQVTVLFLHALWLGLKRMSQSSAEENLLAGKLLQPSCTNPHRI